MIACEFCHEEEKENSFFPRREETFGVERAKKISTAIFHRSFEPSETLIHTMTLAERNIATMKYRKSFVIFPIFGLGIKSGILMTRHAVQAFGSLLLKSTFYSANSNQTGFAFDSHQ